MKNNQDHSRDTQKKHTLEGCQWHPQQLSFHLPNIAGEKNHSHNQGHLVDFLPRDYKLECVYQTFIHFSAFSVNTESQKGTKNENI